MRWNRATKVKIAPANIENVLRFIGRSCRALTSSQRLATQQRCEAYPPRASGAHSVTSSARLSTREFAERQLCNIVIAIGLIPA
jgi:hypothetical protein